MLRRAKNDTGVNWQELGPLTPVKFPADNPYSTEKVALGQALFFDKQLSRKANIACASCHIAAQQWSDQRTLSLGTHGDKGLRNSMPIVNAAYHDSLFWDGRAESLEAQSIMPVHDPLEMELSTTELISRIQAQQHYPALFKAAFGTAAINLERFQQAISTFERTLISQPAAFDRFVLGDHSALSDQQIWGLHLYRTKARCMNCHSGPTLTNNSFHNTGLTYYGRSLEDQGRFAQTFEPEDMGAFRVPSLRDISFTAPYMHNGVFPILARAGKKGGVFGVLAMYNFGMTLGRNGNYPQYQHKYDPFFPVIDKLIQPLGMSDEEMLALAAFLEAVSAPARSQPAPLSVLQDPSSEVLAPEQMKPR